MISCDDGNLKQIGLWGYLQRMPNTLSYLAREVYRNQRVVLGCDPDPDDCTEVLGVAIAGLTSFNDALGQQQNLRRSLYGAYALILAECVLQRHWMFASAP